MDIIARVKLADAKARLRMEAAIPSGSPIATVGDGLGNVLTGFEDCIWVRQNGVERPTWARNLSGRAYLEGDVVTVKPMHTGQAPAMLRIVDRPVVPEALGGCQVGWGGDDHYLCHELLFRLPMGPFGRDYQTGQPLDDEDTGVYARASDFGEYIGLQGRVQRMLISPFTIATPIYTPDNCYWVRFVVLHVGWSVSTFPQLTGSAALYLFKYHLGQGAGLVTLAASIGGGSGQAGPYTHFYSTQPGDAWQFGFGGQGPFASIGAQVRVFFYAYEDSTRQRPDYLPCNLGTL